MWKIQKFTLTSPVQKFREINTFSHKPHCMVFSRNSFEVRVKLLNFHTVCNTPNIPVIVLTCIFHSTKDHERLQYHKYKFRMDWNCFWCKSVNKFGFYTILVFICGTFIIKGRYFIKQKYTWRIFPWNQWEFVCNLA